MQALCCYWPLLPFFFRGMQIVEIGLTQSIVVLQQSVSIVFCLVIAFVINWKLALVTSFLLPFLVLLIFIIGKVGWFLKTIICSLPSVVVSYELFSCINSICNIA